MIMLYRPNQVLSKQLKGSMLSYVSKSLSRNWRLNTGNAFILIMNKFIALGGYTSNVWLPIEDFSQQNREKCDF